MKSKAKGASRPAVRTGQRAKGQQMGALRKWMERLAAHPALLLTGAFLLSALARYLLSVATVNMPSVYIDEGLYVNIARSLFYDGQVMYRDQPISYVYLLYPFALLPMFLLPSGVSLFRAIQLYNALLISSAVFPAYLLGKKLNLTPGKRYLIAFLTLLVPELALSSFLTAESLYYPLMIWMFVLAAQACGPARGRKRTPVYLALGALTGLSYFAKPICIIFGVCFPLYEVIRSLRAKNGREALAPVGSLLLTGAVVLLGYLLYSVCFGSTTVLNLYEKQLSQTSAASIPLMAQGLLYHVLALAFSFGGAYILLPFFYRERLEPRQKRLMGASLLSVLASIVGVAIMVVPYNYKGSGLTSPVHTRYLMFYFPLLLAFFLSPAMSGAQKKKAPVIVLAAFTALSIFPSAFHFFNNQAGTFDAPALNAFYTDRASSAFGILLIILSVLFMAYVL